MKLSPKILGLLEAAGLLLYVVLFASSVHNAGQWLTAAHFKFNPIISTIIFLLAFIISALICSAIVLAYPILVFFEKNKLLAVKIVGWALAWLVIIFVLFFLAAIIFFLR